MACLLMAVAVSLVAELTITVARQQRLCRQRDVAVQEASNALEIALAEQRGEADVADPQLSKTAQTMLPQGQVRIARDGERVAVTVRWEADGTGATQQLRLVGWRFARPEGSP